MATLLSSARGCAVLALILCAAIAIPSGYENTTLARLLLAPIAVLTLVVFWVKPRPAVVGNGCMDQRDRGRLLDDERAFMQTKLAGDALRLKQSQLPSDHPKSLIAREIKALSQTWRAARQSGVMTDDEIRSVFQLTMYADADNVLNEIQRGGYLEGVADKERFYRLRAHVVAWHGHASEPPTQDPNYSSSSMVA